MKNKSTENPSDIIKSARMAFKEKNYQKALEQYKYFFRNSIQINKAYIGVRLSYCLDEWTSLAKVYPPAMDSLIEEKNKAVNDFIETGDAVSFRDYAAICEYLNSSEEAVTLFKEIHSTNSVLSKKIFRSVLEPLARSADWAICREYLGDGIKKYENIIELFDEITKLAKEKLGFAGKGVEKDSIEETKEECLWLLNIHFHSNDKSGYRILLEKMQTDFGYRGYNDLYNEILNDAPKWSNSDD